MTLFNTVARVVGYAVRGSLPKIAQTVRKQLEEYHQLHDIYNDYEGVSNRKPSTTTQG